MKELQVIIVSFNTRELLVDCLRSVLKETCGLDAEIQVVDNASSDGSPESVEREFPQVHLVRNEENQGFGRANNQAIRKATALYVLLLNPDARLTGGSLSTLVEHLQGHPEVGVVGPKIIYPDGRPQPSVFSFPHLLLDLGLLRLPGVRHWSRFSTSPGSVREVDWMLGAALLCRGDLLRRLGGFDERFFMFGEEKDLQYRMARLGVRRVFVPSAVVVHHKAQAVQQDPVGNSAELYRAMALFLSIHRSRLTSAVYRGAWVLGLAVRLFRDASVWLLSRCPKRLEGCRRSRAALNVLLERGSRHESGGQSRA